jgi:outer membrane putative beta-barrel porin/alpha-amylase
MNQRSKCGRIIAAVVFCMGALSFSSVSRAIDVLPGDILPLPDGASAIALYYLYGHNDEYNVSGHTFKDNTGLDTHVGVLRALHGFTIAGMQAQVTAVLPYGTARSGEVGGVPLNTSTGLGDAIVSLQIWPLSNPELGSYIGISGFLTAPTGHYKSTDAVNIGENRWSGTIMLVGSQRIAPNWNVEAYLDWHTYANNNEAGFNGQQTLKQRDSYEGQFYLVHNFSPATSASIGYAFYSGGAVSIDDIENGARIQKQQIRAALNQFVSRNALLTLQVTHDFAVRGGFRQNIGMTLRAAYLF